MLSNRSGMRLLVADFFSVVSLLVLSHFASLFIICLLELLGFRSATVSTFSEAVVSSHTIPNAPIFCSA